MRARLAVPACVLTVVSALAVATAAVPASGASAPAWRVVKTFGPADGVWSPNLVTTGPRDSWSTWIACQPCGGTSPVIRFYLEHSGGTSWKRVPIPAKDEHWAEDAVAIGASSYRNLWFFDPPASSRVARTRALRWNGHSWRVQSIPAWVVHGNLSGSYGVTAEVFGAKSAFVFSLGVDAVTKPDHYVARYNGHSWSRQQLPAVPEAISALSPTDIWALGNTIASKSKPSTTLLMHWNGKKWRTLAVPAVTVPAGDIEQLTNPVAEGPANVFVQRDFQSGSTGNTTRLSLLHWNGHSWRRIALPATATEVDAATQDGHGGLWLTAVGPQPDYRWYFFHRNGKWTRYNVPAESGTTVGDVVALSWIPGTRSVWAAGNMFPPGGETVDGALLQHAG